jgi:polyphosphate kinase
MSAARALISIGDDGVLNAQASPGLSEVWIDRDLSWLDFNERVLAEALDPRTPLLERAKFLAIFSSNLDEFFMKRIAVLREDLTPERLALLQQIRTKLLPSLERQSECYRDTIIPGLAEHGIYLRRWNDLTSAQQKEAGRYFDDHVSPALTPLVIDSAHPFPFISNLSTSLVFSLRDPATGDTMYARVKLPTILKRWVAMQADVPPGQRVLTPLHEVIQGNIHKLYPGMQLGPITLIRLTRDAEVDLDDDSDGPLREQVREQIRQRRYEPAVRLEFGGAPDSVLRQKWCERLGLLPLDTYDMPEEIDFTSLFEIAGLSVPELRDTTWEPLTPPALADGNADLFGVIRGGDLLVHHPYDSFAASVEHFVAAAADDPQTVAIKMTAYRIGDDTPFVRSLIRAAETGKQVACVIEIQARFDEERNLHWAGELESAGAHVILGVRGLKTHAKTILVVRRETDGLRSYVHIGTGNYHVRTARLYADLGLFTTSPEITKEVIQLFHFLTGRSEPPEYQVLRVAPTTMRPRFLESVRKEIENKQAGKPARIVAKMNQLEDPDVIEALCQASAAGVSIDLIIRGFCCLRPGVPGRTENIRIRSIIGRFLEHARIFYFAAGSENPFDGDYFIGSADWMFRNLSRRVEVVTPVTDQCAKERLWEVLDINLLDQRQAWVLGSDGSYSQLHPTESASGPEAFGTQTTLMELARRRNS